MDFKDQIKNLADRVTRLKDQTKTEEATKNAFIMPFIQILGYDVFNPIEVVPEFISDIGIKKGEKIDYAIFKDSNPTILIECKHWEQNLDLHDGQLLRYFHVSKARFGLLTNGIWYKFYSDLVEPNKMDEKPFLEFNIQEIKDIQIEELKKFHKSIFDAENIFNSASELKYTNEIKTLFQQELANPSSEFVKHFAKQVYPGIVTAKVLDQFSNLLKKSIQQYISDLFTDKLKTAISKEEETTKENENQLVETNKIEEKTIETTTEEIEAFFIVKSILRQKVKSERIFYKDTMNYLSIFIDSKFKLVTRLYLNGSKKYISFIDENKNENRTEIKCLDDIFQYSDKIIEISSKYL